MDKAKKKIVSALDGLRNLQSSSTKAELDVKEVLSPSDFCLTKVVRHGFPHDPRCVAFDPVQHLLAIGTGHGSIRILGDAGVDYHLKHESDSPVLHLQFLINEGALISSCKDDTIHLWNFRQKVPEIVHSLQMQKEQVTCIHLPYQSKWLYVGTDKGNVYVVSIGPFTLSGYVINWNKAIDLSCRTHPGAVKHLSDCPGDDSKLLIGFEKGNVALWSLTGRDADRFTCDQALRAISWHWDGRQFVCALADGSLCMWSTKKPGEPTQRWAPHSKDSGLLAQQRSPDEGRRGPREKCRSIGQVEWKHGHDGDELLVFSGGMPMDDSGVLPAITVLRGGKSATVLEMEHPIVAFCTLCTSPFANSVQEPYAVAVLLKNDFLIVDLTTPGYPCFENPYPMDIHESPVTVCVYLSDCPFDLIGALTVVGKKQRRQGFSEKNWPITGGNSRENATGHNELVLTGHQDGSVKFWQASGEHLQILYKLKTGRHFERPAESQVRDTNCYSVTHMELCADSRCLLVAGQAAQVTFFRFVKSECSNEIAVLEVPILVASAQEATESTSASKRQSSARVELKRQGSFAGSTGSHSSDTSEGSQKDYFLPLKVRGGPLKRPGGYQPELVCLIPWLNANTPDNITALALNTAYGLIAIGTDHGLAIVDIAQHVLVWSWTTPEMYGPSDPFMRQTPCRPQLSTASDSSANDHAPASPSPAIERLQERDAGTPLDSPSPSSGRTVGFSLKNTGSASPSSGTGKGMSRLATDSRTRSQGSGAFLLRRPFQKAQTVAYCTEQTDAPSQQQSSVADKEQVRSRSSSVSSQDNVVVSEMISSLSFIESYSKRNESSESPSLWVGTSLGSCIVLNLLVPTERLTSSVFAAPSGTILHVKGHLLHTAFLDHRFCLLAPATDSFRDTGKESDGLPKNKVVTKARLSPTTSTGANATENGGVAAGEDAHYAVLVGEEQIRVIGLPSQTVFFKHKPDIPLVSALATHMLGSPTLLTLTAAGQVQAFSLPSLRVMLTAPILNQSVDLDDAIVSKFCFSHHGLGLYMCTPSELQKFTISSELAKQMTESLGELFVPMDNPEAPKASFLKGVSTLFVGGGREQVDLDDLFGDKCGKPMKSIARVIPGPNSNMEGALSQSSSAAQAAAYTINALHERGDNLSKVALQTEQLSINAQEYARQSSKLKEKYEKKKWYQL